MSLLNPNFLLQTEAPNLKHLSWKKQKTGVTDRETDEKDRHTFLQNTSGWLFLQVAAFGCDRCLNIAFNNKFYGMLNLKTYFGM